MADEIRLDSKRFGNVIDPTQLCLARTNRVPAAREARASDRRGQIASGPACVCRATSARATPVMLNMLFAWLIEAGHLTGNPLGARTPLARADAAPSPARGAAVVPMQVMHQQADHDLVFRLDRHVVRMPLFSPPQHGCAHQPSCDTAPNRLAPAIRQGSLRPPRC